MKRPDRDTFWFSIAADYAKMATCPRAQIGCVIVNPVTNLQVGAGFNGAPSKQAHCVDVGCTMLADHCVRATHAEVNATRQVGLGARNLVAYVVGGRDVCSHCASELYAVGVREVKASPPILRLDDVLAEVNEWQRVTFPKATPISIVEHLKREAYEMWQRPHDQNEWADVLMLLAGAADVLGTPLASVVARKLAVNKERVWGEPDSLGVVEHVRDLDGSEAAG